MTHISGKGGTKIPPIQDMITENEVGTFINQAVAKIFKESPRSSQSTTGVREHQNTWKITIKHSFL